MIPLVAKTLQADTNIKFHVRCDLSPHSILTEIIQQLVMSFLTEITNNSTNYNNYLSWGCIRVT